MSDFMNKLKNLVKNGKNFKILIASYESAFNVLMQIDKIINGNYLSLSESDFGTFKEDGEIDLVLGKQGYSAQFFKEQGVLNMVFIEGGLE